MSGQMIGADPDALEELARQCDVAAQRIDTLTRQLNAKLVSTPWHGHGADRFRTDWNRSHRTRLASAAGFLHHARDSLRRQADEQRRASDGGGGRSGGFSPAGPPSWFLAGLVAALGPDWRRMVGSPPTVEQLVLVLRRAGQLEKFLQHPERVASGSREWGVFRTVGTSGHLDVGGTSVDGYANASFQAGAEVHGKASVSADGVVLAGGASAGVMASALAGASLSRGPLGVGVKGQVTGEVRAHAEGTAKVGPDGAKVQAEAGAMAGVSASADASAHLSGVEAGAGVTAYAGAGISGKATAELTAHHVEMNVKLGVALGIGAGVNVHWSVDPVKVGTDLTRSASEVTRFLHL
jgi:uncharacterized protein YukE